MTEGESTKKITSSAKATGKSAAKKTAKKAPAQSLELTAPPPAKRAPRKAKGVVAPAAPAATKTKAVKKASKPVGVAAAVTTVVAKVDVGFGNALFIRGTGPGLSWEKGLQMSNTGTDEWAWSSSKVTAPFEIKVLINDSIWSLDPDTVVAPGQKAIIDASF